VSPLQTSPPTRLPIRSQHAAVRVYLEEVDEVDECKSVELGQQLDGSTRLVGAVERVNTSLVERERNDRFTQFTVPQLEQ